MSRIGKAIIEVPAGVTVTEKDSVVTVKGPKENCLRNLQGESASHKKTVCLHSLVLQTQKNIKRYTVYTERLSTI